MSETSLEPPNFWTFHGSNTPITVSGAAAEAVLGELETLLPGWRPLWANQPSEFFVAVSIEENSSGFLITDASRDQAETVPDSFSAAYHLAARLFEVLADACPLGLVLHAGAVMADAGAVAFAAPATTGKSTLGAAFALGDHRLLGDDRIVVQINGPRCEAVPLGLAQKLRLPIPPSLAQDFASLLATRPGTRIADSLFLNWDPEVQIPFGAPVPLAGVVLLIRDGTSPPRWRRPSRPDALREILALSATPGGSPRHLSTAGAMVERVPVAILHYESCFEARDAILSGETTFGA